MGAGAGALEPVIATDPGDPNVMAMAYARARPATRESTGITTDLRVSVDGGRTWRETRRDPWDRSGRWPSAHGSVAFGPGPAGMARLYWAGTTSGAGIRVAVAWSDDLGATWSRLHVFRDTPAWIGGFPDVTADRDPSSPGFGTVYVIYAYPASKGRGSAIRLAASGDLGRTWHATDVAKAPAAPGFAAAWRFGSRVRTAPDGALYVSTYQADLRSWDPGDPFDRGGPSNAGRIGFSVTRIVFDPGRGRFSASPTVMAVTIARNAFTASQRVAAGTRAHTYLDPMWSHGLDVDAQSGRVFLAVGDVAARPAAGAVRGSIRLGRSDDGGRTWAWTTAPQASAVDGRRQSSFRPALAVANGVVVVGLHTIDEVSAAEAWRTDATIGTAYAVSSDGGRSFTAPEPLIAARWRASALERTFNGPGLRDRAEATADGHVAYAWADARTASPRPSRATGQRQVYVAVLAVGVRHPVPASGPRLR